MNPSLIPAALADYPLIQNMARFYVYDMSRYNGFIPGWECPRDGMYDCFDFKEYFTSPDRRAFLITVEGEKAGFVLLNKVGTIPEVDWNIGEFFVLAKFQGHSIGQKTALQVWQQFPGIWEVSVIPENTKALQFWRKVISGYTNGRFSEELKNIGRDPNQPNRFIFNFDSRRKAEELEPFIVRAATPNDIASMVTLSDQKRRFYETVQPQFWRRAKDADEAQRLWFNELLTQDGSILSVAETAGTFTGFVIGQLVEAPQTYDPGGLTLMIDDFCLAAPELWEAIGVPLISDVKKKAKEKGATQVVVVCGYHDVPKRRFLKSQGLNVASEWYVSSPILC